MNNNRKRLGDLLISLRIINPDQLDRAIKIQKETAAPIGSIFVAAGMVTEERLLGALATQYHVGPWRLEENPPEANALHRVPEHVCKLYNLLPVAIRGDLLIVAMRNPGDIDAIDIVRNTSGLRVEPVLADENRLLTAIENSYRKKIIGEGMEGLVDLALKDFGVNARSSDSHENAISESDMRPVVGMVNQILTDAIRVGASDIHIEPRATRVEIRYRIDGQLQFVGEVPQSLHPMLTTRLKIMAELDIVESRLPQDGRVGVVLDGRNVDLRVSVLPNHHGQRIVLRILDKSVGIKKLEEIGFNGPNLHLFRSMVKKPYGMVLVTGPTGSGKTTTLYAALGEIKSQTNNVMTCEDPVEYDISGVNQSQVNEKVGLTFARQLRAILRQDPDVILVGEVRDGETAETALRAALTGHLVLSTLHCNDAPSSIPRLIDMGIDPFLLSTTLVGVMSQRLLRVLCPHCKAGSAPTDVERELFVAYGQPIPKLIFHPAGCDECNQAGYRGRTAVHEVMPVTPSVAQSISAREPFTVLRHQAELVGYRPMQAAALDLVAAGVTSIEESERVVFLDATYAIRDDNVAGSSYLRAA